MPSFQNIEIAAPRHAEDTPWLEHLPLVAWMVRALRPGRVVDLGSPGGAAHLAAAEAAEETGADCVLIVDPDRDDLPAHVPPRLIRGDREVAAAHVEPGSVGMLMLDGGDADLFELWRPRLWDKGVVLVLGTGGPLWERLSAERPSFAVPGGPGLGVAYAHQLPRGEATAALEQSAHDGGPGATELIFQLAGARLADRVRGAAPRAPRYRALSDTDMVGGVLDDLVWTELRLGEALRDVESLKGRLAEARRRPGKMMKRRLGRSLLKATTGLLRPLLADETRTRLARSAAKRAPDHFDLPAPVARDPYEQLLSGWARQRAEAAAETAALAARLERTGPVVSVLVPVYNPDAALLTEMVRSVQAQSYPNWELCIADDASTDPGVRETLERLAGGDPRIRLTLRDENGHISRATNSALETATGDYVALVDHDDLLDRDALLHVAAEVDARRDVGLLYTDEDIVGPDGRRRDPRFKPDWNPAMILEQNYVTHLCVLRTDLVREVGGFRVGYEGAQDHDLVLRVSERLDPRQIVHIPRVLYSWRAVEGSTSQSNEAKPYAAEAGRRAVADHLQRTGQAAEAAHRDRPFHYSAAPVLPDPAPAVSVVIPTRDRLDLTRMTVEGLLERTDYEALDILIVDNGSADRATLDWFAEIARDPRVRVRRDDRPFNYSALNNAAVAETDSPLVLLLNNDIEVTHPGWLREMAALAIRADVGCVGAKLLYPDPQDGLQHAGVIIGLGGVAGHSHKHYPQDHPGTHARLELRQDMTAVTAACLMVRRAVYDEVGGLNETDLTVAFNDVDFCLKVRAAGYRNVWTPEAVLVHHESATRKAEDTPEKEARFNREKDHMIRVWGTTHFDDPAYNPNLSRDFEDFRFGPPRWWARPIGARPDLG